MAKYLRHLLPGLKSLDQSWRKTEKLSVRLQDLKQTDSHLDRELKNATPHARLVEELRRTVWGRLALHFARKGLKSRDTGRG